MKRFDYPLDQFQLSRLTSSFREKTDVIVLWMNTIKIVSTYAKPDANTVVGHLVLHVDRMSRLFIESVGKSFSVSFPFSIYETDNGIEFGSPACPLVDNKVTSEILSLINTASILKSRSVAEFADPLLDIVGEQDMVWELLRDLMMADDGYLRVDHDPVNQNGNLHPLHHIDLFYSQSATFKVGLRAGLSLEEFHNAVNTRTDCLFLGTA